MKPKQPRPPDDARQHACQIIYWRCWRLRRSISRSIASRSICERSSNLSSTSSMRASVPTSTLIKRLSEYLAVDTFCCLLSLDRLDFLCIATFIQTPSPNRIKAAYLAASAASNLCSFRQMMPCVVRAAIYLFIERYRGSRLLGASPTI